MGVVLESDSDDDEEKKIVEKEEEESEVRFCPPADFTLCQFYSLSALLTHSSSSSSLFTFVSRRTSFLSLRFEPPMMALTAHSHTLFLSLFFSIIIQEEAESTDEEEEDEEQPKKKKQKKDKTKKKKKRDADSDSENSDVIDDLSGDEVDASLIIPGGRSTRSTRPVFTKQMYAAANLDDESEDEE